MRQPTVDAVNTEEGPQGALEGGVREKKLQPQTERPEPRADTNFLGLKLSWEICARQHKGWTSGAPAAP